MTKRVIIIGAGENGNVVANTLENKYKITGFLDDYQKGQNILGKIKLFSKFIKTHYFFVSIGHNKNRKLVYLKLKKSGAHFVNALHKTSFYEKSVKLGDNIFIGAGCYVNINSKIGNNVFINNGCIIEHDNKIGDHNHLAPGVITGGGVSIGKESFIGLGTVINDHISVGSNVIIGSGAVVINNIPSDVTAAGIPAKIIKKI